MRHLITIIVFVQLSDSCSSFEHYSASNISYHSYPSLHIHMWVCVIIGYCHAIIANLLTGSTPISRQFISTIIESFSALNRRAFVCVSYNYSPMTSCSNTYTRMQGNSEPFSSTFLANQLTNIRSHYSRTAMPDSKSELATHFPLLRISFNLWNWSKCHLPLK